jgi:Protein of unknown function (DUF1588)
MSKPIDPSTPHQPVRSQVTESTESSGPRRLGVRSIGSMAVLALAGGLAFIPQTGCGSSGDDSNNTCVSTRDEFTQSVWGVVLSKDCAGCHTPGGIADSQGAKFKLVRETYPDFVTANINSIREYAKLESEGKPLLLRKPLGESGHGGGPVLKADSKEYLALTKFVEDLRSGKDRFCGEKNLGTASLSLKATYRKAALLLAGKMPTDAEFAALVTEDQLDAAVTELTKSEAFYDRLREMWNDGLLTERGVNANLSSYYSAPCELWQNDTDVCPPYAGAQELRNYAGKALSEEPMRYIEYVVRNDLPFSDVVAGNYIVANPYSAMAYNLKHDKEATPDNYSEWKRMEFAPVQKYEEGYGENKKTVAFKAPVSGVLSTPAFLNRWETTPTNKSRKRARIVLKNFLATDIFKFAQRPVDSTQLTSIQNPTTNNEQCAVCHKVIDPIAGGFRGFDENQLPQFSSEDKWHDDMAAPGFGSDKMPQAAYGIAISWLGNQIPTDQRFGISVAQVMYRGIIGDDPLTFPEKDAPDYADRVQAFNSQNDWFLSVGQKFAASKFNLRTVVAAIIKSPYFRAVSGETAKDGLHGGLGQGRLLTPEMLALKYQATLGLRYFNNEAVRYNALTKKDAYRTNDIVSDEDWRILLGGIDSDDVTKRSDTTTPVMLATNQMMGAQTACRVAAYEFTKAPDKRMLFAGVETNTVPFAPRANAQLALTQVPEAEGKIRATIKALHFRLLGEELEADSAEVTRTYNLFVEVWKDLENADVTKAKGGSKNLPGPCHANTNYDAEPVVTKDKDGYKVAYPALKDRGDEKIPYALGMQLKTDENYTIRAWQAVLTYLLGDYRFNHE